MKKLLVAGILSLAIAGSALALYITANTFNTQWSSVTVAAGSYSESDYCQTSGCTNALLTVSSGTVTSAEVIWYYSSGTTIFSRETMAAGTAKTIRATRAKFRLYCTNLATPSAVVYGY